MIAASSILLLIFAVIVWRSPRHGVFIVLATLPSYLIRFSIGPVPTTMLEVMIWILFIATLPSLLKRGQPIFSPLKRGNERGLLVAPRITHPNPLFSREGVRLKSLLPPATLLFLAATISVFVSPDLRAALGAWKAYFIDPLLFVVVFLSIPPLGTRGGKEGLDHSTRSNPPQPSLILREGVVNALAVCALFVSLAVIIQWLTHIGISPPWDLERRATGFFPYPNANGLLLAPIAVLLFALPLGKRELEGVTRSDTNNSPQPACRQAGPLLFKRGSRWLYLAITLLSLLAMVLTKSEAGLIAAAVGIALAVILSVAKDLRIRILLSTLGISAVVAAVIAIPSFQDKLLLRDWSGIVRRHAWNETISMLRDRPLLGTGLSGYPTVFAPYHTTRDAIEIFQYPHNVVLNFWSETGLLGLAALIWLLIAWYRRTASLPVHAAMAALLIHGLVDVPYFKNDLAVLFWTLIALALYDQKNRGQIRRPV